MDEQTFRVLEFDKILAMAATFSVTTPGGDAVKSTRPIGTIEKIRNKIELISECRRIFSESRSFGIEHFGELSELFRKIKPAEAVLRPYEIRSFLPLIFSSINLKIYAEDPITPGIGVIVSNLTTHPALVDSINSSIDRDGKILDHASPELSNIRQNIRSYEKKIRSILENTLKKKDMEHYLQDLFVAERNNRWVVPVKRDLKSGLPGVVHDISNSGETVYVEPYAIQQVGNELESFRAEEKLEEYRILQRLSAVIRENLNEITDDYRIVTEIDELQAIAGFSDKMEMSSPELNEKGWMKIIHGRHPLLWKTLKIRGAEDKIVPLDIELGRGRSCMVVTGSNAGGKTVTLKTLGVLNLMALSGMHLPAESGTTVPFSRMVFADIGDEQSIEQDLSTFSAHINRISGIVNKIDDRSLIIIDELGTGTDPEQGGALSCAILRKMRQKGALAVVSTHLGKLKAFAHSEPGFVNAAMEMQEIGGDGTNTYRPTYKLIMGEAGTSYAFEIAESLGLDQEIIREARQFMTGEGIQIETLIADLKEKNIKMDKSLNETKRLKQEAEELRASVKEEIAGIRASKQEKMNQAFKGAEEVMRKARVEAGDIIKEIRKSSIKEAKEAIRDLDVKREKLHKMQMTGSDTTRNALDEVNEGQHVFIQKMGVHGVVHSVNEKAGRCKVLVGAKEIMVPLSSLSEYLPDKGDNNHNVGKGTVPRAEPDRLVDVIVPNELKVIGQRVDPTMSDIERYLNDVSMAGLTRVKIIHGIGTGILSRAISDFLDDHPLVESHRKGSEEEGGEGVTIVSI